ncbi:hypothetical protein [Gloeocapsopsis dulcis]|uniref:Uncharacterized protein n=1 Tax=Gloeocapsopsis dulcis AAB1 = 1H9 TaxID=1433147 RepID=A0A6N8G1M8_9CHRO|nr:hypothetical protein [Gloeocapsopsis dulcis]MUL39318.1 hypothetical protein [Gloeocapsopsis dulcis AAB1 = 1H9]WNN91564.1 hypothetical protein P0S91_11020 [Gloeocapsopsis dulcis]
MNQDNQPEPHKDNSLESEIIESAGPDIVVESDSSAPRIQESFKPQEIRRFDIVESQERTRANLATWLLISLGATLFGVSLFVAFAPANEKTENDRQLITLIWTSEVTLVSSALGFYFGSRTQPR